MTGSLCARRGRDKPKVTNQNVAHSEIKHTCTHATDTINTIKGSNFPPFCNKEAMNQEWDTDSAKWSDHSHVY